MTDNGKPDQIDQAIGATQTVEMLQTQVPLAPDGRPVAFAVPRDITLAEAFNAVGALLAFIQTVRDSQPGARIVGLNGRPVNQQN